jgi:sodium/potassium-transporting ATPase subunit alpha
VFGVLGTRPGGLDPTEVAERLLELGPNTVEVRPRTSWWRRLVKQLTNFFTLLLIVSGGLCFVAQHLQPGQGMGLLGGALLGGQLNAVFCFIQEHRVERAVQAR